MERETIWGEEDVERVLACAQADDRAPGRHSVAGLEPNHRPSTPWRAFPYRAEGTRESLRRGMVPVARGYSGTVLVHFH